MNSERLDALSDEALRALAENLGIDLPAELARPFVIEELLDALHEDSAERQADKDAPVHVVEKIFGGSELDAFDASVGAAPFIEPRYNETTVRVLVRDTSWAFVYWDVNDDDFDKANECAEGAEFVLRLVEEPGESASAGAQFDVPVGPNDLQWYLNLPNEGTRYRVDLCCKSGGKCRVLARSNVVTTPRSSPCTLPPEDGPDENYRSLFFLSGAADLDIRLEEDHHPCRILSGEDGE